MTEITVDDDKVQCPIFSHWMDIIKVQFFTWLKKENVVLLYRHADVISNSGALRCLLSEHTWNVTFVFMSLVSCILVSRERYIERIIEIVTNTIVSRIIFSIYVMVCHVRIYIDVIQIKDLDKQDLAVYDVHVTDISIWDSEV